MNAILRDAQFAIPQNRPDFDYAAKLLRTLGAKVTRNEKSAPSDCAAAHPALDWARSGAMAITRNAANEPVLAPCALATAARGALHALQLLNPRHELVSIDAPALLGERAAIFEIPRAGRIPIESCGGSGRLLKTQDAWLAVNLPREDDLALLPAWVGEVDRTDLWNSLAQKLTLHPSRKLVERARLLGLAVAIATSPRKTETPWFELRKNVSGQTPKADQPLVVDLSSLWAGPLCTQLLQLGGARVIKVESVSRPDGARLGPPEFFDLLNADKESVAIDFRTDMGRSQLAQLFERADIIVESARPRAMEQLGFDIEELLERRAQRSGLSWISITGYGRSEPEAHWIAFGDDAAAAAGLAVLAGSEATPHFCGDAIADPLAGLHAALAAQASWHAGGSRLIDISLCNVSVAASCAVQQATQDARLECDDESDAAGKMQIPWRVFVGENTTRVLAPRARKVTRRAPALGSDTARVFKEFQISC